MSLNKVVRDGKVAVLYSSRIGYVWSLNRSNRHYPQMIFDPKIVEFVETDIWTDDVVNEFIDSYLKSTYPYGNFDALCGLDVVWVPEGAYFKIFVEWVPGTDDCYERVESLNLDNWLTA